MSEPNEFKAYFTLTGDFDPADITAQIGLQPSKQHRKGDLFGSDKQAERKFSRWSLESRLPTQGYLEEHVADVLLQLESAKQQIATLKSQWEAHVVLVGFFRDSATGIFLESETISALAEMKLGLDFRLNYEGGDDNANFIQ